MKYLKEATEPRITASALAEKIGVDQSLITLWKTGKRKPGVAKLKAVSRVTGIPIEDLL
jgi:transcriptional regulator with XRE-family HTH domain